RVVCDVHRAALAAAVPLLLAEELAEHQPRVRALRDAVAVPAMRRRDHVVHAERGADPDGDGLLADVEMREARHLRGEVQLVGGGLERANPEHRLEQLEPGLGPDVARYVCGPHDTFLDSGRVHVKQDRTSATAFSAVTP